MHKCSFQVLKDEGLHLWMTFEENFCSLRDYGRASVIITTSEGGGGVVFNASRLNITRELFILLV